MERLNESQLRAHAAAKGFPVSGRQFRDFRHWGLIPSPDTDSRWPASTVDTLVTIRARGNEIRSLPRRVILLRCDGLSIPADRLRSAMRDVAPTIRRPVRAMRRVARARRLLGEPTAARLTEREWRVWEQTTWKIPEPSQWPDILDSATEEGIDRRVGIRWYLAALWMRELGRDTPYDLSDIPLEEMLTMMAIQDVSFAREHFSSASSSAEEIETS